MPSIARSHVDLSLFHVEEARYDRLDLNNIVDSHWIVSHVIDGEVQTTGGSERNVAKSGYVMIHPAYLPFSERASGGGMHQWVRFDLRMFTNTNVFDLYPVPLIVRLKDPREYAQTFDTLLHEWGGSSSLRYVHTLSLTVRLIELVLLSWEHAGKQARPLASSPHEDRLLQVIHYMSNNLASPLTRKGLADLVHLHPVYLDRVFSQQYGCTVLQMLRSLRLNHAQELLETTNQTVQEVAGCTGFWDAAYLSRVFTRAFGMTPAQCRRAAIKANSSYMMSPQVPSES